MTSNKTCASVILFATLAVGVAVLLAACGGGAEESAATSKPLTKPELISKVNSICRQSEKEKLEDLDEAAQRGEGLFESTTPQALEDLVESIALPNFEKVISQLNDLQAAGGQEEALAKIIGAYETAMEKAEARPIEVINSNPFQQGDEAARAFGIKNCKLGN